jgi:hypothetical protein
MVGLPLRYPEDGGGYDPAFSFRKRKRSIKARIFPLVEVIRSRDTEYVGRDAVVLQFFAIAHDHSCHSYLDCEPNPVIGSHLFREQPGKIDTATRFISNHNGFFFELQCPGKHF